MRKDVDAKEVAELYLEGRTIEYLRRRFQCHKRTIENRLKEARERFPDLKWSERTPYK